MNNGGDNNELIVLPIMDTLLTLPSVSMAASALFPLLESKLITLAPLLRIALAPSPFSNGGKKPRGYAHFREMAIIIIVTILSVTLFSQLSILATIQPILSIMVIAFCYPITKSGGNSNDFTSSTNTAIFRHYQ